MAKKKHRPNTKCDNYYKSKYGKYVKTQLKSKKKSAKKPSRKQLDKIEEIKERIPKKLPIFTNGDKIMTYEEYLKSTYWKNKIEEYKSKGLSTKCYVCENPDTKMYHKNRFRLGREEMGDIQPLCEKCSKLG